MLRAWDLASEKHAHVIEAVSTQKITLKEGKFIMKNTLHFLLMALLAAMCSSDNACFARGGGGGGGHGGGSRPVNRPAYSGNNFNHSHEFDNHNNRSEDYHRFDNYDHHDDYSKNYEHNRTNINNYNVDHFKNYYNNHTKNAFDQHPGYHPNYGNWYHGHWNEHWGNAWWYHRPAAWWTAGFIAGTAAITTPWNWGYWPYYNPYAGEAVVVEGTTLDYSQPIVSAETPTSDSADEPARNDRAMSFFSTARQAFYEENYPVALKAGEQALALQPDDVVFNEFRGATLFAMEKYQEAAGVVYAVLSIGPGWDWATMSALYPNVEIYTKQLRALEEYVRSHPDDAAAHFLLAYHYLMCNHTDAAAKQLKEVVRINPQDTLSSQLLKGLTEKEPPVPVAADQTSSMPKPVAKPVAAENLVGTWNASRPDGSSFALTLSSDGKFSWKFSQKNKTQEFAGPYSVADNLLILKQNENPVMVGQITMLAENKFNFKLPGENSTDPGLTFSK
jgi:tetratricopeptide (TPR) repeat protein